MTHQINNIDETHTTQTPVLDQLDNFEAIDFNQRLAPQVESANALIDELNSLYSNQIGFIPFARFSEFPIADTGPEVIQTSSIRSLGFRSNCHPQVCYQIIPDSVIWSTLWIFSFILDGGDISNLSIIDLLRFMRILDINNESDSLKLVDSFYEREFEKKLCLMLGFYDGVIRNRVLQNSILKIKLLKSA